MTSKLKLWTGLGLGTVLLGASLTACSDASQQASQENDTATSIAQMDHADMSGEGGETGENGEAGESGETGHSMETLPIEHRLAFMTGHVKAGLALYRAGVPEQAAPHLLHPVSETHQSERKGLDVLGFKASLFETVSKALEEGRPAHEIEPQLIAAEKNLDAVALKAGGNHVSIIRFLMNTIVDEYSVAITDGVVSDPGEYQDAFGFAHVAMSHAMQLPPKYKTEIVKEIDELIDLWPNAPIAPKSPTPIAQVIAKTSAIQLALPPQ